MPQRSPLTLECVAAGLPAAAVRWERDGRDALRGGRWALQHSHLVTEGLQPEDSGNYSCVVGEEAYINYSLTVLGKDKAALTACWFSHPMTSCILKQRCVHDEHFSSLRG